MNKRNLVEKAKNKLNEEEEEQMTEEIKMRLQELKETEKVLKTLKKKFEAWLDDEDN